MNNILIPFMFILIGFGAGFVIGLIVAKVVAKKIIIETINKYIK